MTFTDEESIIADILNGIDTVPEMLDKHVPPGTGYKYSRKRYGAILRDRIRKSEVIIEIGIKEYPYTHRMVKRYGLTEKSEKVNESQFVFLGLPAEEGLPCTYVDCERMRAIHGREEQRGEEMIEPKPCPFCECDQLMTWHIGHYDRPWIVECCRCLAQGPHADTESEAMELWNRGVKE